MDVKWGSGAFMDTHAKAEALAESLRRTGEAMGTPVRCVLSDMNQPLGAAVGNTIEVLESIDLLRGSGPADIRDLTLRLVGEMLVLGGLAKTTEDGIAQATAKLDDGSAMKIFRRMVARQGGDVAICDGTTLGWSGRWADGSGGVSLDPAAMAAGPMKLAGGRHEVRARTAGKLAAFDTRAVGIASCMMGAGRLKTLVHDGKGVAEAEKMLYEATKIG
jgi:thymidine phosphorylase